MHSLWLRSTFLRVLKLLLIKEGGPNFSVEVILQKVWIMWSNSILKNLWTKILFYSLDFDAFCLIQEYLSQTFKISISQRGGPNFWGKPILQKVWIICPPPPPPPIPSFSISILKLSSTQILRPSTYFKVSCMIQKSFSKTSEISAS